MNSCHEFLQIILPTFGYRWAGFRKVRRQVCRRIHNRMQELGIGSYRDYFNYIEQNTGEQDRFDAMLDITISRFWRDKGVFTLLERTVFPDLIEHARKENRDALFCWSAGCCNGEEPYSLQLLWKLQLSPKDIDLNIVTTDRNTTVLDRARQGCFPEGALKDVPDNILDEGFEHIDSSYCIKPPFKNGIQFLKQDIRHEMPDGPFDIILCRNFAVTYFDRTVSVPLLNDILSRLRSGGYFIIGSTETLPGSFLQLIPIKKGEPVYQFYPV